MCLFDLYCKLTSFSITRNENKEDNKEKDYGKLVTCISKRKMSNNKDSESIHSNTKKSKLHSLNLILPSCIEGNYIVLENKYTLDIFKNTALLE